MGPDGAGKSALLDEMERQLGFRIERGHSRPGLLAKPRSSAPISEPHAAPARGSLTGFLKLLIMLVDSSVGGWTIWRRAARKQLLVVERGWYDIVVDPQRYRLSLAMGRLASSLGRLVPRADLTAVLTGDPAEIHDRKPELGSEEVARQLERWREVAARSGRDVVILDTVVQPVEATAAALIAAIRTRRCWRMVPVSPKRLELRATGPGPGLRMYLPRRRLARLAALLNPMLLQLRLAPRVPSPGLPRIATLDEAVLASDQLVAFRSSVKRRWIIGISDRAGLRTVVKVGRDDDGLEREYQALRQLASSEEVRLPALQWTGRTDGWFALATRAFDQPQREPSIDRVGQLASALVRGDLGEPVVHGDLAPWNMAADGDRLLVWDWEAAEVGAVRPLHDLTHYLVRSGCLLGRYSPEDCAGILTSPSGVGVQHLVDVDVPAELATDLVLGYLGRTRPSTAAEHAFRSRLADILRVG